MQKQKFFLIGMAVLLGVSLVLAGCPTDTETETVTNTVYDNTGAAYGTVTGEALQELIDAALAESPARKLTFKGVTISSGNLDLKTANVTIEGTLTLSSADTVISAAEAAITFAEGATVSGAAGNVIIGDAAVFSGTTAPSITVTEPVAGASDLTGTGTKAIKDLTLTGTAGNIPGGLTVYVYGTLTVDADSVAPTGTVKAIGTVSVAADNSAALAGTTVDITGATLTNSAAAEVTLPATVAVKGIKAGTAKLTIADTTTSLTVGTLTGDVAVTGDVTFVVIGGGAGNIEFSGEPAFVTTASSFGNTGTTTFAEDVSAAIGITFDGPVVFKGDLTLTAVPATFKGVAYFVDEKSLKTTAAASVVTLGPGAALAVDGYQAVWGFILANYSDDDVTLTPSATATSLKFVKGSNAKGRSITQSSTSTGAHSIEVDGEATLVAGSTYTVSSASSSAGTLTVADGATLTVGDGLQSGADGYSDTATDVSAKIVLTGAAGTDGASLAGTGKVVAGGTEIVGGWQAVGADTSATIEADTITGSALTGVASGSGTITVAAGETLTIAANTTINVATSGTIKLAKPTTASSTNDGAILNLSATTAKIDGLTGGSSNQTLTTTNIANATYTVGSNTGDVAGGGESGAGKAYITGGNATGPNTIKAADDASADVSIDKDTKIGADT